MSVSGGFRRESFVLFFPERASRDIPGTERKFNELLYIETYFFQKRIVSDLISADDPKDTAMPSIPSYLTCRRKTYLHEYIIHL